MSVGTVFFPRETELNSHLAWGEWSGYHSAAVYADFHDIEYNAIREAAGVVDVSPLYKYVVRGRDAGRLLDRVMTRDISKLQVDQVYYTPWCDEDGKVIDDGTLTRLSEDSYRLTAADPCERWFRMNATGLDVDIEDISDQTAGLALQGRLSREVLEEASGQDWTDVRYFRRRRTQIADVDVDVTRTGYTGDRGYELWMPVDGAIAVWDSIFDVGRRYGIHPVGIRAMDVARVEAGLILIEVEYSSSHRAIAQEQHYSPFELGLGRLVDLSKASPFNGRRALLAEQASGGPAPTPRRPGARMGGHRRVVRQTRPGAGGLTPRASRPGARLQGGQAGGARHEHHVGPDDQEDGRLRLGRQAVRGERHAPLGRMERRGRARQGRRDGGPDAVPRPRTQAHVDRPASLLGRGPTDPDGAERAAKPSINSSVTVTNPAIDEPKKIRRQIAHVIGRSDGGGG